MKGRLPRIKKAKTRAQEEKGLQKATREYRRGEKTFLMEAEGKKQSNEAMPLGGGGGSGA